MAAIQKIQASLYAIGKRLQGYHLLKNPTGTSQTEVNMIKEWYGLTVHLDDMFHIERIKKTFSPYGNHEENKVLISKHYMDVDKMQLSSEPRKKDMIYSVIKDGKYLVFKKREDIPLKKAEKRAVPKLSFDCNGLFDDSEYDKMLKIKQIAKFDRGYYKKGYPLSAKILSLGMHKRMFYPKEIRPNFFKILYHNLSNRG